MNRVHAASDHETGDSKGLEELIDTVQVQWNYPNQEQIFFQHPYIKPQVANLQSIHINEIKRLTQADEDLQTSKPRITGAEELKGRNLALFKWFLTRQSRLAAIDGFIYICDTPSGIGTDFQIEQAGTTTHTAA